MGRSYFIRFTPTDPTVYSLDIVRYVIDTFFMPEKYVIGREKASSEHYHIALWNMDYTPEALRYQLKNRLKGQIYISGKEIEDKIKSIAYCFKDGDYIDHGLSIMEFLQATSISKPKIKYDDLLAQAEELYDGDDKKFTRNLLEAHIKTNKKIYLPHIKAQVLLTKLKKDRYGTYKEYLVEKIIDYL